MLLNLTEPRTLERLFAPFFGELEPRNRANGRLPLLDVWEGEDAFYLEAELPGLRLEDLELTVLDNAVSIKGHRQVVERDDATRLRHERAPGDFERHITLPSAVDSAGVTASLRDGILEVTLPKPATIRPRKIEIS